VSRSAAARVPVSETLQVGGHPEVYAIGDLALVRGMESIPQVAQAAIQQGHRVAANVQRALCGAEPLPFRYWDPGTMATIGRDRAVAMLFGVKLAGRLAWLFWLVAHIVFLAGFRNRATVFVNWIYHYLSYDLGPGDRGRPASGASATPGAPRRGAPPTRPPRRVCYSGPGGAPPTLRRHAAGQVSCRAEGEGAARVRPALGHGGRPRRVRSLGASPRAASGIARKRCPRV
jgi:hypothetical protein